MGETVIEKIIRNNVGKRKPGDIEIGQMQRWVMIHEYIYSICSRKV